MSTTKHTRRTPLARSIAMAAALLVVSLLTLPIFAAPCCTPDRTPTASAPAHGCCGPTCEMKKTSDAPRSHVQSIPASNATPSVPQLVCTVGLSAPQTSAASLRDSLNAFSAAQDHESAWLTNLQLLI